jgi:hypothetical protein
MNFFSLALVCLWFLFRQSKQVASMNMMESIELFFALKNALDLTFAHAIADLPHERIRKAVIKVVVYLCY